jgi:hypothetical protein
VDAHLAQVRQLRNPSGDVASGAGPHGDATSASATCTRQPSAFGPPDRSPRSSSYETQIAHDGLVHRIIWEGSTRSNTADLYELIRRAGPGPQRRWSPRIGVEWLGQMADAMLAQSAIDRLQSAAHGLDLDAE